MLTFRQLVRLYFQGTAQSTPTVEEVFSIISSVKFKDKNVDMILAYISIINAIWIELVIDPGFYHDGMFNFASMVSKGARKVKGKWSITGLWGFFVKSVFGQIGQLKSMVLSKGFGSHQRLSSEDKIDNSNPQAFKLASLVDIISTGITLLAEKSVDWKTVLTKASVPFNQPETALF